MELGAFRIPSSARFGYLISHENSNRDHRDCGGIVRHSPCSRAITGKKGLLECTPAFAQPGDNWESLKFSQRRSMT